MYYIGDIQKCEDIVQDFFLFLWNNSGTITIKTSLRSYLYTSIKNRCLNHLRDLKIEDKYNLIYLEAFLNRSGNEELEDKKLLEELFSSIDNLSPDLAEIFYLKYYEGKKISEIASEKQISENTIKKRLLKAKEILKEKLTLIKSIILSL